MAIPNVTLIHPSCISEELVKKCSLVVTIGGSTGFQATFHKKPSVIFSDTVYSILPSVYRVRVIEDLPKTIRTALQKQVNESDLDKYLTLLDEYSFEIDLYEYQNEFSDMFYYNGWLVDVEISEPKMKSFLDENKFTLEKLTLEYVRKIKEQVSLQAN